MRVVLDTNILISLALVSNERTRPIWDAWRAQRFEVLACTELLNEVTAVLARPRLKRYVKPAASRALLTDLQRMTSMVQLEPPYPSFEDPADRFLLALARDGGADALITGDKALLTLGALGATVIASPADFVAALHQP